MIVIRFKVRAVPEKADELADAFAATIGPSRAVPGVVTFDIARGLDDPNTFVATEVFDDLGARARQEALPEVGTVLTLLETALAAPPEATQFHVAAAEPAM